VGEEALSLELECIAAIENEKGPSTEQKQKILDMVRGVIEMVPKAAEFS
jgi:hypothetical protein